MSRNEYLDILAKRVLYSRAYTGFYLSLIGAGLVEVVWIVLPQGGGVGMVPHHGAFTLIESYVTVGLILELSLRASLQNRVFWTRFANLFDVCVAAVSVLTTLLFVAGVETRSEALFADLLVTGRIFFRLMRLLAITKSFKRQQATADRKMDVEFGGDDDSPSPCGGDRSYALPDAVTIDVAAAEATSGYAAADDDAGDILPSPHDDGAPPPYARLMKPDMEGARPTSRTSRGDSCVLAV